MSFDELKDIMISMGIPDSGIRLDASREDAGLDSIAVVELALLLRSERGLQVTEDELAAAGTIGDVAALVAAR
ncbi:acyl carrier protein [Streptomyces europaeiscabiei]|uniref:acyl carrier protein n=1 Tax=Streptomyces europaeiscabiei TaxID=146819 RepID=UPI0029AEE72B|nr:acyl carrier protein [Streptomyces europaeiscabiei]MDX3864288.1 acyl carrier protein [Streptomyces europaeiscabiei]MDX3871630.1 acyl carrier protein [Streptomyces europaeiscabiei]